MDIEELKKALEAVLKDVQAKLPQVQNENDFRQFVASVTGRKGTLTALIKKLSDIPQENRPEAGKIINNIKTTIEDEFNRHLEKIKQQTIEKKTTQSLQIDITLPGFRQKAGKLHPLRRTLSEIVHIFSCMGFDIAEGPEVETDWYNFEALGFPPDHPARQMQATFYIRNFRNLLLRTHTSPVQIRHMIKFRPPIKIIAPGVVYRHDDDPSHSPMFTQVEGLVVDDHTTFSDLKGTLEMFLHEMFGHDVPIRFRPSFFPFTEPSGEVDIACPICGIKGREGCSICKGSGWTEILGCGQVDPVVFENVGIDPENYQGYAFGLGVDRIAMFKFGIDSIQHFYKNDPRFLEQF